MTASTADLQSELDALRSEFAARMPAHVRDALERADLELAGSGAIGRALKAGDVAPDFTLADTRGDLVNLAALAAKGPVVLSFYRGGWCPYCNLELRALQQAQAAFAELGASLIAVSPQTADNSRVTVETQALLFPVLSDNGCAVAQSYGLAYDVGEDLRAVFTELGHLLPAINGTDRWLLPVPATYLIDRDRRVLLASVDTDFRHRLEPQTILDALDCLSRRRARCIR